MTTAPTGSRKAAQILFASFIVVAVGAFIWGFIVVDKVRVRARETDGALRSVAWACLCYAQQENHQWPDCEATLIAANDAWACERVAVTSAQWPATRDAAMAGSTAPATVVAALEMAGLEFSKNPQESPHITALGNPSGLDTLEVVNGWLTEYAKAQVSQPQSAPSK